MTTLSEVVVHTEGEFKIIRWKFWPFRCQTISTVWIVMRGEEKVAMHSRLRDAKAEIQRLAMPLRERLCTPMTVGQASIAASTVL